MKHCRYKRPILTHVVQKKLRSPEVSTPAEKEFLKMAAISFHLPLLVFIIAVAVSRLNASNVMRYCPPEVACPRHYDVVVMLDISTKVDKNTFKRFVQLIKDILHLFDIGKDRSQFGLVLYNRDAEVIIKLNELNDTTRIKNYLMNMLPKQEGGRNLARALRETRRQLLTPAMGDLDYSPNICFLLTTERRVRDNRQFLRMAQVCDQLIVLRRGGDDDLQRIRRRVCPEANNVKVDCERKLRCRNGKPIQAINGCCKCKCLDGFSGPFCEDVVTVGKVSSETYSNGSNPDWTLEMSSSDNRFPIQETLKRSDQKKDETNRFGSFEIGDRRPSFALSFRGPGRFRLWIISVHLISRRRGTSVTITFFKGNRIVRRQVRPLRIRVYAIIGIILSRRNVAGMEVTRVQFDFSERCTERRCFGINDLHATYTQVIDNEINCDYEIFCSNTTIKQLNVDNGFCYCDNSTASTTGQPESTPPPPTQPIRTQPLIIPPQKTVPPR